jgi:epoxyqueuosine reductase
MSLGANSRLRTADIKQKAIQLGFDHAGVAPLGPFPETDYYPEWLASGYAGEMKYLERGASRRLDPTEIMSEVRTVVVCALNYQTSHPLTAFDPNRAWVSRYAWGGEYHDVLKSKLDSLAGWIEGHGPARTRAYVDTGPVLERVYAKYAGIGWFGKNTCIINEKLGSWLFLGCILTDLELDHDMPAPDRCGSCTRCIDACPTDAILEPYVLDSRKCISYLTIELRGDMPEPLREGVGHHLFGCDICQDVCPWNRKAPLGSETTFQARPDLFWPELERLLDLDEDQWTTLIRGTALKRSKVRGLLRNLMVVVGNSGLRKLRGRLTRFLSHSDDVVRSHAKWAAAQLDKSD